MGISKLARLSRGGVRDELQEEIGLDVTKLSLIEGEWQKRDYPPNREHTKVYFLNFNESLGNLKFNDGEVDEVKWMRVDGIKEAMKNDPAAWSASFDGFKKVSEYLESRI